MNLLTNPIVHIWKWWFTPRSTDPTVVYRERALRFLLPVFFLLRALAIENAYTDTSTASPRYFPLWVIVAASLLLLVSLYFLLNDNVGWSGAFFLLNWYLMDMFNLPADGYWNAGFQISLVIQVVLAALLLPSRGILPFLILQLVTVGIWGHWLDINHFDPPLLSSGQPVAIFRRTIITLIVQESIILFIVRYLRIQMEKSLRLQQVSIQQLEAEVTERQRAEARLRGVFENSPALILEVDRNGIINFANITPERFVGSQAHQFVPTENWDLFNNAIKEVFEKAQNTSLEAQVRVSDGSIQWNSIRLGPVLSDDKVTSLVAIITNIHAQKETALQIKQRADQLTTIVEIGRAVSTLQDLESVLEIIYQQIQHIAPVDAFYICLLSEDKKHLTFPLTYDMGVRYNEPDGVLRPESRVSKVIQTGEPYRLHRTAEEVATAEKNTNSVGNSQRKSGSLLFVPLWQARKVIGVLSIQSYALNAYPDELVETMVGVGNQVAIAIQNARLFTNVQQELAERKQAEQKVAQTASQLTVLNDISRAVSALTDLNSTLEIILEQVKQVITLDAFFITLYNPQTNMVSHALIYDQNQRWEEPASELMPGSNSSQVIQTGKSILRLRLADEFQETAGASAGVFGNKSRISASLMFVPMIIKDGIIGVISAQSYSLNAYNETDLKLLQGVANQVAIAIENARLFTNVQQELTERQRTEARLRGVFENSPDIILEIDRAGQIIFINRYAETHLGKNVRDVLPVDQHEYALEMIERAFNSGEPQTFELQTIAPDNRVSWDSIRIGSVKHGDQITSLTIIMTEITAQKDAEAVLRAREELYRLISTITADYVFSTQLEVDGRLHLKWVGGAFESITGYTLKEYVARGGWLATLHPDDQKVDAHDFTLLQANQNVISEVRTFHKSGDVRWVRVYAHPLWDTEHNRLAGIYGAVQDITERKRTEQEREKLFKEIETKNAELERFNYTISHELKSPVVTIKGFLGMLKKDMKENRQDKVQKDFERISEAAEKMGTLLSELLELSRIGRVVNPPEEVDLAKLVHEALEMLNGRIQFQNITVNISSDLPIVYGDKIRLREVFENLVDNAAKYMGDQSSPLIEIGNRNTENEIIFFVKDNGIGIEPKYHTRVFGLFEKLNATSEGTGIGLALIKRIIEVHGGRIWVESEGLRKGSTFCFTIPDGR